MDFDLHKLIGTKLPSNTATREDKDYVTADRIREWRHECKAKTTYLQHGNLISFMMASVLGEPNMFFVPEDEDIVVVIANSPMVSLIPQMPDTLNYAFYVLWPELRKFDTAIAMKCVQQCARNFDWIPHSGFGVVMDQDIKPDVDGGPPGMSLFRGCLVVHCQSHAKMTAHLAGAMSHAWNLMNSQRPQDKED